jgi:SAM-dependent methyltransferase
MSVHAPACRSCGEPLTLTFCDLGLSPPSNALTDIADLARGEMFYPLHVYVCTVCFLVQLEMFETPEQIFRSYAYFSSYSTTWLEHAKRYVDDMIEHRGIGRGKKVVEVASNDGYLLQYFRTAGIDVLGIEPATNVAEVARERGIPTLAEFFGTSLAREVRTERGAADLIVCNNVLAHVPDINDFVAGLAVLLAADGFVSFEFPHLLRLIEGLQFDTIYHEHFSYLSLIAIEPLLARHGLEIFDVVELSTHGGSLRVFAGHRGAHPIAAAAGVTLAAECEAGLDRLTAYSTFPARVLKLKCDFLAFLCEAQARGETVAGYGAAAKATTLLNHAGVRTDLIPYVADVSPHKQGRFIPGVRIPIVSPERLRAAPPDYVVIFPWNIAAEIRRDLDDLRDRGARFVTAIPALHVE